jgi:hypothetical protein
MTTSLKEWSAYAELNQGELSEADKAYFRAATRRHVYGVVLDRFMDVSERNGFSRADMARKLRARPEQITRWLSSPSNWTLDTLSDLLLSLSCRVNLSAEDLASVRKGNYAHQLSTSGRDSTKTKPIVAESDDSTRYLVEAPNIMPRVATSSYEEA